jgi:hypothetical protein
MKPHNHKISIVEISKRGVCKNRLQVLALIIRTNNQFLKINSQHCGQQLNSCIIQLPIVGRSKTLKKNAPLNK